jgi:hypothetical protein
MFNVTTRPEFTHTVHVQTPVDGGHKEETFQARFRVIDEEEGKSITFSQVSETKVYLRSIVVSMDDLGDSNNDAVSYNDEIREQMLALPHVRIALLRTYNEALAKARVGN